MLDGSLFCKLQRAIIGFRIDVKSNPNVIMNVDQKPLVKKKRLNIGRLTLNAPCNFKLGTLIRRIVVGAVNRSNASGYT